MRSQYSLFIVCLLLQACGQAEFDSGRTAARRGSLKQEALAKADDGQQPAVAPAGEEPPPDPQPRKIIYVANVELVVEDFAEIERQVQQLVDQHGGYLAEAAVDRTHGEYPTGRWIARIPVGRFGEFLDSLEQIGVPERRTQTADDVTEEYIDLEARVANKRRLEERILELLEKREGKINEVIEVERELSRVREEIEQMEGRLRFLQNRTAFTTVTITAREERDYVPSQAPTFAGRVGQTWTGSLRALRQFGEGTAIAAVAATPWLVPAVPLLLVFWWAWKRSRRAARRA